ncbi:colicin-like pore-forming protein [Escherichia coli]|uniref:colicin-like pore-forming protein n=1 Tax=Escherichia coli TaxID=562 RepID=UPI00388E0081
MTEDNSSLVTLKSDVDKIKDAVAYTATFYEKVTEKYGEKAELLAKSLADKANGKTIRGVDDALAAFDRIEVLWVISLILLIVPLLSQEFRH